MPLLQSLKELGVKSSLRQVKESSYVMIYGGGIKGGKTSIRGDISSQFVSGLLFACPKAEEDTEKRSMYVLSLIETGLAGVLGVPGLVPYSESIGIITMTRVASRIFLIIGSLIFMALSFLGPMGGFMAAMPKPVAGAILLGIASTVIGSGAQVWSKSKFGRREILITGFSIFLALGLSSLPDHFWNQLPRMVATIFNNPSITVTLSVIVLEQIFFRKKEN